MQYTDIGKTEQKLFLITGHARRDRNFQFTSLAHLLNVEYLRDCYKSLNRNKAVGIDNVSWLGDFGVRKYDEELGRFISTEQFEGNPHARFCEGEQLHEHEIRILRHWRRNAETELRWILNSGDKLSTRLHIHPKKNTPKL